MTSDENVGVDCRKHFPRSDKGIVIHFLLQFGQWQNYLNAVVRWEIYIDLKSNDIV